MQSMASRSVRLTAQMPRRCELKCYSVNRDDVVRKAVELLIP
jgi:hypothetical protein